MTAFMLPASIGALIAAIHVIFGGRDAVRPLMQQSALPKVAALTHYYCWHLVTIQLIALALAFAAAAVMEDGRPFAWCATILAAIYSVWGLGLVIWSRQRHRDLPQWALFAVLSCSGLWALLQ